MDEILFLLLKRQAHLRPTQITTTEIGIEIGMSQQNASARLVALEKNATIERSGEGIKITQKGYNDLVSEYAAMKSAFEGGTITIEGTLVSGLGEGGYYVSIKGYKDQIKQKLGFDPYPGTLNVKIEQVDKWKKQQLMHTDPIIISGFKDKERTYGDLFAYRCKIKPDMECAVIVPLRTHHGPEIIEIISPVYLRSALKKKDGDKIMVSF